MRAIVINKWVKSLDELTVDPSAPEPDASGKDAVTVRVRAVGANFFDTLMVQGTYQIKPPLPFIPGSEFAGDVIGVTPGTGDQYKVGDRVFGSTFGCYAERLVITTDKIFKIPEAMSYEEAAGMYITLPTSYAALVLRANLQPGEWCLVHAGAGGVGLAAVQIAKALGARVIATAGSSEKLDVATRLGGADHALNYTDGRWTGKVIEITKGKGCDVVFDPVGMIETSMKCAAWSARLVVVGFAGGGGKFERVAMNRVLLKNVTITGLHWGAYTTNEPDRVPEVWEAIFRLLREGRVRPVVYKKVYRGLEAVPEALRDISSRKTWGKVIVTPEPAPASSKL